MAVIHVIFALYIMFIFGTNMASAMYGGGACNVPTTAPGASTLCTAKENGYCLIDTIDISGKASTGICICYPGYSGTKCADKSTTNTATTATSSTRSGGSGAGALGGLAALGLLAYFLSQGSGGLFGSSPAVYPQEVAYLRQGAVY